MNIETLRAHLDEPVGIFRPDGLLYCNRCGKVSNHALSKCPRCDNKLFRTKTITWRTVITQSPEGVFTPRINFWYKLQKKYLGKLVIGLDELPPYFVEFIEELREMECKGKNLRVGDKQ